MKMNSAVTSRGPYTTSAISQPWFYATRHRQPVSHRSCRKSGCATWQTRSSSHSPSLTRMIDKKKAHCCSCSTRQRLSKLSNLFKTSWLLCHQGFALFAKAYLKGSSQTVASGFHITRERTSWPHRVLAALSAEPS